MNKIIDNNRIDEKCGGPKPPYYEINRPRPEASGNELLMLVNKIGYTEFVKQFIHFCTNYEGQQLEAATERYLKDLDMNLINPAIEEANDD